MNRNLIVISGGQIGVDRAALDAAIETDHVSPDFHGWCPRGRRAKDGQIPDKYKMREHESAAYPPRTQSNIAEADASLVLPWIHPTGGTAITIRFCEIALVPHAIYQLDSPCTMHAEAAAQWLWDIAAQIVNITGPGHNEVYKAAYTFMHTMLLKWDILNRQNGSTTL